MFFTSPSTWKMVKDSLNHVPMKMISLAQTSREILEDGDVPIFVVFFYSGFPILNCDFTGITLSTFYAEVNTVYI